MRLVLAAVGAPRTPWVKAGLAELEERVRRYFRFRTLEVRPAALPDALAGEAREREARALLDRVPTELELIALAREGVRWSTRDLARRLADLATYGGAGATFVVGSAHGLGPAVLSRAELRLSLSSMTLPHELARLVLTEQLYRAGTILRGEPYHKGP